MAEPIRPGWTGPSGPTAPGRGISERLAEVAAFNRQTIDAERIQYATAYDPSPENIRKTAEAARDTKELLEALVLHAVDADKRERTMLHWTKVGVILAGLAAVAGAVAIIVTIAVAP